MAAMPATVLNRLDHRLLFSETGRMADRGGIDWR
jgi:hypothetical protein